MRRPGRVFRNVVTVVSLAVCVATAALWYRSGASFDQFTTDDGPRVWVVRSSRSKVQFQRYDVGPAKAVAAPGGFESGDMADGPVVYWWAAPPPGGPPAPPAQRSVLGVRVLWGTVRVALNTATGELLSEGEWRRGGVAPRDARLVSIVPASVVALTVPHRLVVLVTAIPLLVRPLARLARQRRASRRRGAGLCPGCGYDLHGNVSGVCPECGNPTAVAA